MVSLHWDKSEAKKIKKATVPLFHATHSLHGFLKEYINILEEADEFLKKPEGEAVAKDAYAAIEAAEAAGKVGVRAYKIGDLLYAGVKQAKQANGMNALGMFLQADCYAVKEANIGFAVQTAAPGYKIAGKTIVTAGTTTAKALSGSLAGIGIALGIWDVFDGAKKIKNRSQLAAEFRKSSESYKTTSAKLITLFKKLQ